MQSYNRNTATMTLAVTSLLYFACLPMQDSFAGRLAVSVFGAAMVGGLADWFAVSALFRRPLGIRWRTAVIPRNRERLFAMIVQMVQEEFLSKENIRKKIADHDITSVVVAYLEERGGAKTAKRMLHKLLSDVLEKVDPAEAGQFIANFMRQEAGRVKLSSVLRSAGEWTIQAGYDQKLISFVAAELVNLAAKPDMRLLLSEFFAKVLASYEGDRRRRKVFNNLAGLSPDGLAFFTQQRVVLWLSRWCQENHPVRETLRRQLSDWLLRMDDSRSAAAAEQWLQKSVYGLDLEGLLAKAIRWLLSQAGEHPQETARWFRQLDRMVDHIVYAFHQNPAQQQIISDAIKQALCSFVEAHHDKIGSLVRDRLNQLSDDELVNFIEEKVGDDLQMIRVNGTVVGGLTGAALYFLTYWL